LRMTKEISMLRRYSVGEIFVSRIHSERGAC
jgi:hypothetical protein